MIHQPLQTYEVDVVADDIDELGHVNNVVYLKLDAGSGGLPLA